MKKILLVLFTTVLTALPVFSGGLTWNKTEYAGEKVQESSGLSGGRFRLELGAGIGSGLAPTTKTVDGMVMGGFSRDQAEKYIDKLKTDLTGTAGICYLLNKNVGVGLRYKLFLSWTSASGPSMPEFSERIWVNYLAPAISFNFPVGNKQNFILTASISAGMTLVRNIHDFNTSYIQNRGSCPGFNGAIGAEYRLSSKISVFGEGSVLLGNLTKVSISDGADKRTAKLDNEFYSDLTRIDVTAGLRFSLSSDRADHR